MTSPPLSDWARVDRLFVTSLRLLVCPCGKHDPGLARPGTPAAQIEKLLTVLDRHARRIFAFGGLPQIQPTTDEIALHQLVAAAQRQTGDELRVRACWFALPQGQAAICRSVVDVAATLLVEGYELSRLPQALPHKFPGYTPFTPPERLSRKKPATGNVLTPVFYTS